jgi:hypothetical protein
MKITIPGILVFLALVAGFFWWIGGPPKLPAGFDSGYARGGVNRAWFYSAALFIAGAGTACFADQEYGMFPPTSLRWLFIIFGAVIMLVAAAWMHSLGTAMSGNKRVAVSLHSSGSLFYHRCSKNNLRRPPPLVLAPCSIPPHFT